MIFQYDFFNLALAVPPPVPVITPLDGEERPRVSSEAANDNHRIWPLLPFPEDWCASN